MNDALGPKIPVFIRVHPWLKSRPVFHLSSGIIAAIFIRVPILG